MASVAEQLANVTAKTERLIELCQALQHENDLLKNEREALKASLADSKNINTELDERLRVLKMARSFSDTDEKNLDIKQKINEFVREIDKCIALLKR
ncbi:hypothetical protein [Mucilaginibacter sp. KACC 22063]|uniref:hypothetical protein n=1 Tax=Mucilaginibacter sp. KACC 22063 TaxID=3025666 RepID=UPI002366CAEF|nr:hypothetical protein [Mucilaginibacter sp. KACC 22063]WDF54534.1 hypothetical protein PQ461_16495 [Mucilaginibacter sp. KACC 22063]